MRKSGFIWAFSLFVISCGGGGGGGGSATVTPKTGTLKAEANFPKDLASETKKVKVHIERFNGNSKIDVANFELTPSNNTASVSLKPGDICGVISYWNDADCPVAGLPIWTFIYRGKTSKLTIDVANNGIIDISGGIRQRRVYTPTGNWEFTNDFVIKSLQIGNLTDINCDDLANNATKLEEALRHITVTYTNGTQGYACYSPIEVEMIQSNGTFNICLKQNPDESCIKSDDNFKRCVRGEFQDKKHLTVYWYDSANCTFKVHTVKGRGIDLQYKDHTCERQLPIYALKEQEVDNKYYTCSGYSRNDTALSGNCTWHLEGSDTCIVGTRGQWKEDENGKYYYDTSRWDIESCSDSAARGLYNGCTGLSEKPENTKGCYEPIEELEILFTLNGFKNGTAEKAR
jgi:hypothetical protein